ncbi:MAG: methionyl-tRNA formyltransferase [Cyanobacteria bacterium QH_2_48_84]|nr:MAG: methionyl-tRNA formyltransferase [Cyanobacteria bacterium QH_2_48_84]
MKIIFFGTPQFAVPSLERLLEHPEMEVLATVTQPDKPKGRGKQLTPSPVKKVASAHQLPVWQPKRVKKDAETITQLKQAQADAFVVVAYGQILSQEILDVPKLGCINVHGSLLPNYRGAAPIQWCLYYGEAETGITTMLMDAGMDTGDMLLKIRTSVGLLENADTLAQRWADLGGDLLLETLLKLKEGKIQPTPQDASQASYAPPIQKSDYAIDWSRSAIAIHNQVRGFFPNCVASLRSQTLKVLATVPLAEAYSSELPPELQSLAQKWSDLSAAAGHPGEVVSIIKKMGPIVQTGEGLLLLTEVQPSGKRPRSGGDFVNGMRLSVGEVLDNGGY